MRMEPAGPVLLDLCSRVNTDQECVRSDLSSFSYSLPVSPTSRFRLQEGYPSILVTLELSRRLSNSKDSQAMRGLAQIFFHSLTSIVSSMDSLPEEVRTFPDYELAYYGAIFTNGLLSNHAENLDEDGCDMVLGIMEMAFSSLEYFLEVADKVNSSHEASPIPQLTDSCSDEHELAIESNEHQCRSEDHATSTNIHEAPSDDQQLAMTPESFISELPATFSETETLAAASSIDSQSIHPTPKRPWQFKAPSLVQRVLRLRPSLGSLLSSARSKSATTLVGSVDHSIEDGMKQRNIENYMRRHKALPDIPYVLRQSAVYFLPDPLHPEVDVDMPELSGETVAVRLSPRGEIKTASLTALIRMITSKDVIKNPRINRLFFCGLGYFISPGAAIAKLVERFHEQPPSELTVAQLRVWTREALVVRIRVGHAVALWLEQYWNADIFDSSVLAELQRFALRDLLGRIPDSLFSKIVLSLEDVACARASRTSWRKRFNHVLETGTVLRPTGFELALLQKNNFTLQLSQFFVPQGIEELARHLTGVMHDLHCAYDPGSAVRCWFFDQGPYSKIQSVICWERSLYFWVIREILNRETLEARVDVIEFWVRVAWECLSLLNFSCASAIHGALVSPPIYRLKKTLMSVDVDDKHHFTTLNDYFNGFENYGKYRQAIDDLKDKVQPYIPLLVPLIRGIEAVKTVQPTVSDEVINLTAVGVIQRTLSVLEGGQLPYRFERTPFIVDWLKSQLVNSYIPETDEWQVIAQLDHLSASREPKCIELAYINAWVKTFADGSVHDLDRLKLKKPSILSRFFKKS